MSTPQEDGGTKFDAEKLRWELVPFDSMEKVVAIFTHGAKKYGDRNWERGLSGDRLFAACMRHLIARRNGELIDEESGEPHLAHAATNLLMWMHFDLKENK